MWTIDAQCDQCGHKPKCKDRPEILKNLSGLTGKLNTEDEFVNGQGDGRLIVHCQDRISK